MPLARTLLVALVIGSLTALSACEAGSGGGDRNCSDFQCQGQAQAWHNSHPGSDLDADHDGLACENLPSCLELEEGDGSPTPRLSQSVYDDSALARFDWSETRKDDGSWSRDGVCAGWSREGIQLVVGSYVNGKREGQWTFRHEDGSFDASRSGFYVNDVRVQEDVGTGRE